MWISRAKFNRIVEAHEQMMSALKSAEKALIDAQKHAHLISIERDGRSLKFTFARNGEIYVVETMSLLSDNMKEWKEKLLR